MVFFQHQMFLNYSIRLFPKTVQFIIRRLFNAGTRFFDVRPSGGLHAFNVLNTKPTFFKPASVGVNSQESIGCCSSRSRLPEKRQNRSIGATDPKGVDVESPDTFAIYKRSLH